MQPSGSKLLFPQGKGRGGEAPTHGGGGKRGKSEGPAIMEFLLSHT